MAGIAGVITSRRGAMNNFNPQVELHKVSLNFDCGV